jgi:hypothetical protein
MHCRASRTRVGIRPLELVALPDGGIWVGDLGAQSIFAFDGEGELLRVLDSMAGFAE